MSSILNNTHIISVKFLNLTTNVGGGYDINRHCFVCDIKGLYSFYVALASANDSNNFVFYMNVTLCAKDTHDFK